MGGPALIDGEYHEETNNFQIRKFFVDGLEYSCVECYFQAAKATSEEDREYIRKEGKNGLLAWDLGGKVKIRSDWEEVKVDEMYKANKAKFDQNPDLVEKLIQSKGRVRFLGFSDFWNYWNSRVIERIRAELRNLKDDKRVSQEIQTMMEKYRLDPKGFKFILNKL